MTEIRPEDEQWTHYYKGGAQDQKYSQLDYILLSRRVCDAANDNVKVKIIRKGLPYRAERYSGSRFTDVGEHHPKASDHCPVVLELPVAALTG